MHFSTEDQSREPVKALGEGRSETDSGVSIGTRMQKTDQKIWGQKKRGEQRKMVDKKWVWK